MTKGESWNDKLYVWGLRSYIRPLFAVVSATFDRSFISETDDREWERLIIEVTGALPSEVWS